MGGTSSLFGTSAGSVAVIALLLALAALAGTVLLLARQQRLLGRYQQLMAGTSGGNLEGILTDHIVQVREAVRQVEAMQSRVQHLENAAGFDLQHLGLVRFNPFSNTGGDQSFALALIDGHGRGVVLSSLHTRDMTRVYAKPLEAWLSPHSLTDEEKQAIELAHQNKS
jgi:hypothetical protein